jgi:hypothetical protein
MSAPELARHGQNVKPAYASTSPTGPSPVGQSTDAERPDGNLSGIVKRYSKRESAAPKPISLQLIKRKFGQAIEYSGIPARLRGLMIFTGLLALAVGGSGGYLIPTDAIKEGISEPIHIFDVSVGLFFMFMGCYVMLKSARLELFRPEDEPIIFDRKNRKVYRLFRETYPGIIGTFKHWPMRAAEYEWDLIDVEHYAELFTTGSTVDRRHALLFLVRKSATDPTIIDSFNVGSSFELSESTLSAVWEHIRRFVEEGGPHLPPGEALADEAPPETLWASMDTVGPFGPRYMTWWREHRVSMVLFHLLAPITVPMFVFWGFLNWLSYSTAIKAQWPSEVLAAVQP